MAKRPNPTAPTSGERHESAATARTMAEGARWTTKPASPPATDFPVISSSANTARNSDTARAASRGAQIVTAAVVLVMTCLHFPLHSLWPRDARGVLREPCRDGE